MMGKLSDEKIAKIIERCTPTPLFSPDDIDAIGRWVTRMKDKSEGVSPLIQGSISLLGYPLLEIWDYLSMSKHVHDLAVEVSELREQVSHHNEDEQAQGSLKDGRCNDESTHSIPEQTTRTSKKVDKYGEPVNPGDILILVNGRTPVRVEVTRDQPWQKDIIRARNPSKPWRPRLAFWSKTLRHLNPQDLKHGEYLTLIKDIKHADDPSDSRHRIESYARSLCTKYNDLGCIADADDCLDGAAEMLRYASLLMGEIDLNPDLLNESDDPDDFDEKKPEWLEMGFSWERLIPDAIYCDMGTDIIREMAVEGFKSCCRIGQACGESIEEMRLRSLRNVIGTHS